MSADEMFAEQLIEIFAEEIDEVVQQISIHLAVWKDDLHDVHSLKEIRRSFHTIKGSGRMVQAQQMADLAWAVENMLNHVLDRSIIPNPAMVVLLDRVVEAIPVLLTAFKNKQAAALAGVNVGMLIQHADSLRKEKAVEEFGQSLGQKRAVADELLPSINNTEMMAELKILQDSADDNNKQLDALRRDWLSLSASLEMIKGQSSEVQQESLQTLIDERLDTYSREVKELRYFVKVNGEKLASSVAGIQHRLNERLATELGRARSQHQSELQQQQLAFEQLRSTMMNKIVLWSLGSAACFSFLVFAAVKYLA